MSEIIEEDITESLYDEAIEIYGSWDNVLNAVSQDIKNEKR